MAFRLTAHIIDFIISFLLLNKISPVRKSRLSAFFTGLIFYGINYFICIYADLAIVDTLSFFILSAAFILLSYKEAFPGAAFVSGVMTVFLTGSEIFVFSAFAFMPADRAYIISLLISRIIYGIIIYILYRQDVFSLNKKPFYLFIYPLSAFAVSFALRFYINQYKAGFILTFIASALMLISLALTFMLNVRSIKNISELNFYRSENEKIRTDEIYYKLLSEQNDRLKALIHDSKNHMTAIKNLPSAQEKDSYIESVYGEIKYVSVFGNTDNKYLDLLINKYMASAESYGIDFIFSAKTSNLSFMEPHDLIAMAGNILDNAFEAAKCSEAKTVELDINKINGIDVLSCVNSCDKKPLIRKGKLISDKNKEGFHGCGMKSIIKTAEKYRGETEFYYDDNKREFTLCIAFLRGTQQ